MLEILFQDEFLVAVNKPAGMMVHPGREPEPRENIAMKVLRDQLGARVHPIHRLDRPTSGVLLFALDKKTAGVAQQAFENRLVKKTYLAVIAGSAQEQWSCQEPIQPSPDDPPQAAETHFRRILFHPAGMHPADPELGLALIQARPVTGRFHQIRRHLLAAGTPIVGDFRYAGEALSHRLCGMFDLGTRMLLQASTLELVHPHSGEALKITAPIDVDFLKCFPEIESALD
ncbi:hypothetical protein JIN85_09470 [Luteolibacter pohnpeiensis]|uniref:tRNA pseudouridine synthase C n=1 Tax=Luteolibacter pohnpeiensis TaxID=454153 RepID=A0A934S7D3_9BACT|nr:pseudouridine synthase [Luteolibacter pohnpeiensis]MBK1882645.1 hypothetical protein [Luteolibacter pohnpeiensis]